MDDFQVSASTNRAELEKFDKMAQAWWDPKGPFKPLHKLNPTRLAYVRDALFQHYGRDGHDNLPLAGLRVLDIGCGGGLMAEPLARLGAKVTGIDVIPTNIEIARIHAQQSGLKVDYQEISIEDLNQTTEPFDLVMALEVVEHVEKPADFIATCSHLMKEDGIMIVSTLNRNLKSFALGIVAAEYILGWLPKGTHDWRKFPKPEELKHWIQSADVRLAKKDKGTTSSQSTLSPLRVTDQAGMHLDLLKKQWKITSDLSVNYLMTAKRI